MIDEIYKFVNQVEHFWIVVTAVATGFAITYHKLKKIYVQVVPNGGSSLADTINDIRKDQQVGQTRSQLLWEHQAQLGYYECDPVTGACTFANKYLCDLFGMSLEQFLGFGWLAAIESQAERDRIHKSWTAAVEDKIPYREHYHIIRGNELLHVETRAWSCKDKKTGNILKMFGTLEIIK